MRHKAIEYVSRQISPGAVLILGVTLDQISKLELALFKKNYPKIMIRRLGVIVAEKVTAVTTTEAMRPTVRDDNCWYQK